MSVKGIGHLFSSQLGTVAQKLNSFRKVSYKEALSQALLTSVERFQYVLYNTVFNVESMKQGKERIT